MQRLCGCLALALCLVVTGTTRGEAGEQAPREATGKEGEGHHEASAPSGGDDPLDLGEMVVTPTRRKTKAFDTSLPLNVLKPLEVQRRIAMSMPDLLLGEPGVDAVTVGTGSFHPMIRGLSQQRVLVLVDGIRMSEQRPGGNHVFSLDPAQIERIEVVRGPASVLYGSDAIGGVMNIFTKKADEQTGDAFRAHLEQSLSVDSATDGWKETTHLRFGKGRFNFFAGGFNRDAENIDTPHGHLNNSFYEGYTWWAGGNYIGDDWKLDASYYEMRADIGIPAPAVFKKDYFKDETHRMFRASYQRDSISEIVDQFKLDFGFQRHGRHRVRRRTPPVGPPIVGDLEVNIWLDIDTYTLDPQLTLDLGGGHVVTTGVNLFYEDAGSDRTIRDTASGWVNPVFDKVPVIPDSERLGAGFYVQDEISVTDRLIITPGFRYDTIESRSDGHPRHQVADSETVRDGEFSGNLGVLYKLTGNVNLYGNVGRAFRAPTLLERFFDGPHDVARDIGNPDLEPETSWNFDTGVKMQFERWSGTASVFYNRIDDYIVKQLNAAGDYEWMNFAEVRLYGAEAGLDYQLGHGFSVFATGSHVRGRNEETGGDLPAIPPLKARYGLRCDHAVGEEDTKHHLWAELSGTSAARQKHPGPNEKDTAGWTRFDFRAGYDLGDRWSLLFAVENLTDKSYHDHLSGAWQLFDLYEQAGRNFKLMATFRF